MAERCACGHDYWDHESSVKDENEQDVCHGDFGMCQCEEFTYLGEEEE